MFVDTHLHLADSQFDPDRDIVIQRAQEARVSSLIEIAESPDMWEAAVKLAESHPSIYASLGIHPHHAHQFGPSEWPAAESRLRELLKLPKVVAIGEFGLDYYRMQNTREQQDYLFRKQMELAKELNKPIVLHCRNDAAKKNLPPLRGKAGMGGASTAVSPPPPPSSPSRGEEIVASGAHEQMQKVVAEYYPDTSLARLCPNPVGVIHCFSGSWEDAQAYLMHGFYVGVDGPVTYPKSDLLKENVRRLPLERIVLETDAPYLPPQTHRGQRNEPSHIPAIAAEIAALKRKSLEEVAEQTTLNARRLFRLHGILA